MNQSVNSLTFLGTAGARFVMIKQLRSSGGMWVSCAGTQVLIDPGPGSLVRCAMRKPALDPASLEGIILTHRHLDHANDINVMIEAMTEGGFKKRGEVFCPRDALQEDAVILRYAQGFPAKITMLEPLQTYRLGAFTFKTSMLHIHPAMTFGLKFTLNNIDVGLLTDTRYFESLKDFYRTEVLVVNVVFWEPRAGIDHLSLKEAELLLDTLRPRTAVLTHFGMTMLKAKPALQARLLSKRLGIKVVAACDGMTMRF
jgi:phosphoribosyl 1,2-cyclic phosphodiesterase